MLDPEAHVPLSVVDPPTQMFGLDKAVGAEGIGVTVTTVELPELLHGGFAVATQAE
jgi:hypothetical protein